jgi:nicotinamide riboside kinase
VVELWSKIKFKKVDEELYQLSKSENFDFYLLCKPDIPWEKDNLRENPEDRDKIFIEYEAVLKRRKLKYKIIKGSLIERLLTSLDFIKNKN